VTIRRRLLVSGDVQGVFYREGCRRRAERVGVAGSAENLADGRVEVILEGEPGAVEAVEGWCRHGPPQADVASIEAFDERPRGDAGFTVR
jgi:acylphosphatase